MVDIKMIYEQALAEDLEDYTAEELRERNELIELGELNDFEPYLLSYSDIYKLFGDVVLKKNIGYYQGDMLLVLEKDSHYGFLVIGYGSCSYCDSLKRCETIKQLQELSDRLENSIKWFNSLDALKAWWQMKDHKLEWYGNEEGWKEFGNLLLNL